MKGLMKGHTRFMRCDAAAREVSTTVSPLISLWLPLLGGIEQFCSASGTAHAIGVASLPRDVASSYKSTLMVCSLTAFSRKMRLLGVFAKQLYPMSRM